MDTGPTRRERITGWLWLLPYLLGGYVLLVLVVAVLLEWYRHGLLGGH